MRENNTAIFMLRMSELGIPPSEERYYTMGMINDMLTEAGNDHEKYHYRATQEDFDRL